MRNESAAMSEIIYQKEEFLNTFRNNTVTIVTGETGCGKTTQIPRFLYDYYAAQKLPRFLVGVTQPRRLAATSIANRIGSLLNSPISDNIVGHKIMYENTTTRETKIKIMTEGILLKELYRDPLLMAYNVVVLDEIHERSTNMEVITIFLTRIAKRRIEMNKELKIVLMSATMTRDRFTTVFSDYKIGHFHVKNNGHKVGLFYETTNYPDYLKTVKLKIMQIFERERREAKCSTGREENKGYIDEEGFIYPRKRKQLMEKQYKSILVFLPGKSDIQRLKAMLEHLRLPAEIMPLHSGMTWQEQQRIYDTTIRKIILSTNIAEASITVPDVFYVIDTGLVKNKHVEGSVVHYKVEFVSKQNAIQRTGRAGRTGPGVCYRLFTGAQFEDFPDEIQPQYTREKFNEILFVLHSFGISNVVQMIQRYFEVDVERVKEAYADLVSTGILVFNGDSLAVVNRSLFNYPLDSFYSLIVFKAIKSVKNRNVLKMVIVAICYMQCALEITHNSLKDVYNGQSDFIRYLYIFDGFKRTKNPSNWAIDHHLSYNRLIEIEKLSEHLYKMVQQDNHSMDYNLDIRITEEDLEEFSIFMLYIYKDNIAVRSGDLYIWKNYELLEDQHGVNVKKAKYVVFDAIQQMGKNKHMRNVAVVKNEWLISKGTEAKVVDIAK